MKTLAVLLALLPAVAFAESSAPLKLAHSKGFLGCDDAISYVFKDVKDDFLFHALQFSGSASDSIKLVATFGPKSEDPDEGTYHEAEFRKIGGKCHFTQTLVITMTSTNCTPWEDSYRRKQQYKPMGNAGHHTWLVDSTGGFLIFKNVNVYGKIACMVILGGQGAR